MYENKGPGFVETMIREAVNYVARNVSAGISAPIEERSEAFMKCIEDRVMLMERRAIRAVIPVAVAGLGAIFLLIALMFFLIDYLHWNAVNAFLFVGVAVLIAGLLLKIRELEEG